MTGRERDDEHDEDHVPSTFKKVFVFGAGGAVIAFLLVFAWLDARAGSASERVKRLMPAIGAEVVDQPLTAEQATWRLETASGQVMTLAQLPRDRLVFLNFWATWCPPCRNELPSMIRLARELRGRAFMMVAVSYDPDFDSIRAFFMKWLGAMPGAELLLVRDPNQDEGQTLRERFGTTQIPDTYVIYQGRIVSRFVDARNWVDPGMIAYFQNLAPPLSSEE